MTAPITLRRRSRLAGAAFVRGQKTVAAMARAQVVTSDKNPFFRRSRGKGLTEEQTAYDSTKAVAQALEQLLATAWKKAKVTRRDARKLLVIDASTGKRYPSLLAVPKTRKIFLAKVDSLGRRRLYNPVDNRTLAKGVVPQKRALKVSDFDWRPLAQAEPKRFRVFMTEMASAAADLPAGWKDSETLFEDETVNGDVDPIALRISRLFSKAVRGQADHTQWQVEFNLLVAGQPAAIPLRLDPLRSYQFFKVAGGGRTRRLEWTGRKSRALLRGVVAYKLRDVVRRALADRGLVSSASARRVRTLAANEGRRRGRWLNAQGGAWAGAGRTEVKIEGLEFRLRRVL